MGMFDYLNIDNKWIPKEKQVEYDKQEYQTKSLDCLLHRYEILEGGELIIASNNDDDIIESENYTPVIYTGEIDFYDNNSEFKAWCVNGVVREVVDVS